MTSTAKKFFKFISIAFFFLGVTTYLLARDVMKRADYAQLVMVQENLRLQKEIEDLRYEIWSLNTDLEKQQKPKKERRY